MLSQDIQTLQSVLGTLPSGKAIFAASLIDQYKRRGSLTVNQAPWIGKLITLASNPAPMPAVAGVAIGDSLAALLSLFATAQQHLKFPKIVISDGADSYTLKVAGSKSKAPGYVNVTDGGSFQDGVWFGRISPAGTWEPSKHGTARAASLLPLLSELAANPAATARKHGKLTGHCCFCNLKLTDVRSTAAGFGPVCAEHFGLKSEWVASVAILSQVQ